MDLYDVALKFFRDEGWPVVELAPGSVLQTIFNGDSMQFNCYLQVPEGRRQLVFYSLFPSHAREPFGAIEKFLSRANHGLIIGNFEFDSGDGGIRYKTSIDGEDREPTAIEMRNMVQANVYTMNRYAPGIAAVLSGDEDPIEAIARLNGGG